MKRTIAVLASRHDPAGMNIASRLLAKLKQDSWSRFESACKARLVLCDQDLPLLDGFEETLSPKPQLVIFASRHESGSKLPCLTVHSPGNVAESLHGGRSRCLSMASPLEMRKAVRALKALSGHSTFQVTLEATHHGPLTDLPCFFIEIGSGPAQWEDEAAGEVVAEAILSVIREPCEPGPVAVGFGGPHYSPGFTELLLRSEFSISHIVPKHQIAALDDEMLRRLMERSQPSGSIAVLDWKGIRGAERKRLLASMERAGVGYVRLRECLAGKVGGDPC